MHPKYRSFLYRVYSFCSFEAIFSIERRGLVLKIDPYDASKTMNFLFFLSCDSNLIESNVYDSDEQTDLCDISIVETAPFPGSVEVYYRDAIRITLSQEDPTAQIQVSASNTQIVGEQTYQGNTIVFQPNESLKPSTDHKITVSYCGSMEPVQIDFTTSDLGTPLNGGSSILEQRSYSVDLNLGTVIEPIGIGDFLQTLLDNQFLIDIQHVTETEAYVRMALSSANTTTQNYCVPTIEEFPVVELNEDPFFTLSGTNIPIVIDQYQLLLYDFSTFGTINPQATAFMRMEAVGVLDLREVFPILQDFNINANTVDEFVNYLDELNVEIISCNDTQDYCMKILMNDLRATEIQHNIEPVCEPNCHSECNQQDPSCDTPQEINEACTE